MGDTLRSWIQYFLTMKIKINGLVVFNEILPYNSYELIIWFPLIKCDIMILKSNHLRDYVWSIDNMVFLNATKKLQHFNSNNLKMNL